MVNWALIGAGVVVGLLLVVGAAVWLAHRLLDGSEDWNPWGDTVTLPVVRPIPVQLPGRHRLELLTHPFRLPGWD